jgi:FkbM family methyltransferase
MTTYEYIIRGKKVYTWTQDIASFSFGDAYEAHVTKHLPAIFNRPGGFIDVGANVGFYMAAVKSIRHDIPITNFEPNKRNFACLVKATGANAYESVLNYNCGASDVFKTLDYADAGSDWYHNGCLADLGGRSEQLVMAVPLDHTPAVDIVTACIKIDVEGHELHVLRGARRLIAHQRPYAIVEFCPQALAQHGTLPVDVLNFMFDHGYKATVLENQPGMGLVSTNAEEIVKYLAGFPNWICDILFTP